MSVPDIHTTIPSKREAVIAALREENTVWLFVVKTALAYYLSAWLAMRLALPQPSTTMVTTIIVANRQTGMVLAKSFYRAIGTFAGALAALVIVALFPQERVLFLSAMSLWVGLCAGGATLYRNFKAYAFVLAGYTAALVALPIVDQPLEVFHSAVWRVSEVLLGLAVSGAVSDLIFPSRIRDDMRRMARAQFANFVEFVQRAMCGKVARADLENAHLRFVRDAVTLEDLRSAVIFEDPEARARSRHIQLFNQRFMAASTSLQALHHLINRLKRSEHEAAASALVQLYQPISEALDAPIEAGQPARELLPRLASARQAMIKNQSAQRLLLTSDTDALDFDTGAALVNRFSDELYDYVDTASALQAPRLLAGAAERVRFERGNDYIGAGLATVRTVLTMGALSFFWIGSAWPQGSSAMVLATVFAGLFASAPNPGQAVIAVFKGYLLSVGTTMVCLLWVLPQMSDFFLLVAGSLPFLMIGLVILARPSLTQMGGGYCLGFTNILGVKNLMSYDAVHFFNDIIAQLTGIAAAGIAFVFVPTAIGTAWFLRRQLDRLRRQVGLAASAPLPELRSRFESINHDLFGQIIAQTERGTEASRTALAWTLSVHEMGRTLIELRNDMAARTVPADVREVIERAIAALSRLYEHPDAGAYALARDTVNAAIVMTDGDEVMRPLLDHLHLLRLLLLDDQSVLAAYMPAPSMQKEVANAT